MNEVVGVRKQEETAFEEAVHLMSQSPMRRCFLTAGSYHKRRFQNGTAHGDEILSTGAENSKYRGCNLVDDGHKQYPREERIRCGAPNCTAYYRRLHSRRDPSQRLVHLLLTCSLVAHDVTSNSWRTRYSVGRKPTSRCPCPPGRDVSGSVCTPLVMGVVAKTNTGTPFALIPSSSLATVTTTLIRDTIHCTPQSSTAHTDHALHSRSDAHVRALHGKRRTSPATTAPTKATPVVDAHANIQLINRWPSARARHLGERRTPSPSSLTGRSPTLPLHPSTRRSTTRPLAEVAPPRSSPAHHPRENCLIARSRSGKACTTASVPDARSQTLVVEGVPAGGDGEGLADGDCEDCEEACDANEHEHSEDWGGGGDG
ncbi:hypothetical protein B0H14DRAFT_2597353 [Mycena olivaceomarginata]|nr:hypothetical protein B0H14DRAFT_2597353 [Mycena olivaceomarginata]